MLIKHSKNFLEKQKAKSAQNQLILDKLEQEDKKISEKIFEISKKKSQLLKLEERNEINFYKGLINTSERLAETIKDLELSQIEFPHHTLEEYKLLFEMTRFVRLNIKLFERMLIREVNPFREIEPIQSLILYQIQILKDLKMLGLLDIRERYSLREIKKKLKEIDSIKK